MARGMGGHQDPVNKKDEWLTPPAIIEALGGWKSFDLDPCAPIVRPWPTARRHFTKTDDGLSQRWKGRVWLNSPYGGAPIIGPWMKRIVEHGEGTALIFARTETVIFFETVWRAASAVLFLDRRLTFFNVDGTAAPANGGAPSALVAYGARDATILEWSGVSGHFIRLKE